MHGANHIFLSYRRGDTAGHVGRLYEELQQRYLPDSVFMDIDGIAPGQDFVAVLDTRLADAKIVLVLIGPRWFGANADGTRRIDDAGDFVRMEVAAALSRADTTVIPLLCGGATMPTEASLPAPLAGLARRNAFELSDLRWRVDVQRLFNAIDGLLKDRAAAPSRRPVIALAAAAVGALLWFATRSATPDSGLSTQIPKAMEVAGPPAKLVAEAKEQLVRARREWSSDAQPWNVEVTCGGNTGGLCDTRVTFESPSKLIGLFAVRWQGSDTWTYSQYAAKGVNQAVSLDVIELDSATARARAYGLKGRVDIARIEMRRVSDGRLLPYWQIIPGDYSSLADMSFCLEGWSGNRVRCAR